MKTISRISVPNSVLHLLAVAILLILPLPAAADHDFPQLIQPAPASAGFEDPGHIVWCGTVVRDDQGKCHIF